MPKYPSGMSGDPAKLRHNLLQRLDLALATQLANAGEDVLTAAEHHQEWLFRSETGDNTWVAATLGLRGLAIRAADVADVLGGRPGRFRRRHQEHALIFGMQSVLQMVRDRAAQGTPPDGWFLVELFKVLTADVARLRRNSLRGDHPWDGLLYVNYPEPAQLKSLLDSFTQAKSFRDVPGRFLSLHPVRQSFRILWRFARLCPFPDFNIPMSFVAMNAYLLAKGYPLVTPLAEDRELFAKVISGPPPLRLVQLESRLLQRVETGSG